MAMKGYALLVIFLVPLALLGAIISAAGAAPGQPAALLTVNSPADAVDANPGDGVCAAAGGGCTLRAAVQESNALAGANTIMLPAGVYTLTLDGDYEELAATGDLDLTGDVTISGAGADQTIVNGNNLDRVFDLVGPGVAVEVANLTVERGNAPGYGGAFQSQAGQSLALASVTLRNNWSYSGGGGVAASGALAITGATFLRNQGFGGGGAIFIGGSGATIQHTVFISNSAGQGGAIYDDHPSLVVATLVTGSDFSENRGYGYEGGAILIGEQSALRLVESRLRDNSTARSGGAIFNLGRLIVERSDLSDNVVEYGHNGGGGAIFSSQSLWLLNSSVTGNRTGESGSRGGGLYLAAGAAHLENSTLSGNQSPAGGALAIGQGFVAITNTTIAANSAGVGGGLYERPDESSVITILNSILAHNGGAN
jgi:CSLREA domain-containing protein